MIQRLWGARATPNSDLQAALWLRSAREGYEAEGTSDLSDSGGPDSAVSPPSLPGGEDSSRRHLPAEASSGLGRHPNERARYDAERSLSPGVYSLHYTTTASDETRPHEQLRALRQRWLSTYLESGVSSAVVHQGGRLFHWLQGDEAKVTALWQRFRCGASDGEVEAVFQGETARSMLDVWSMGLRSLESPNLKTIKPTPPCDRVPWQGFLHAAEGLTPDYSTSMGVVEPQWDESFVVLSLRSALGGQLLTDAAAAQGVPIEVTRWGAAADMSCDLQTLDALIDIGGRRTLMGSFSARSLRVGAVRETIRRRSRWILAMSSDDVAELDHLLNLIDCNTPSDFMPQSAWVTAPAWTPSTKLNAMQQLQLRGWSGGVHALDIRRRGAWKQLPDPA